MNVAKAYAGILEEELVPAMGCTEPIAIAYAAAIAREVLEAFPEKILVECSGNVIKNVKSVSIPNTDGLCGIEAAAVAGAVAGDRKKKMEVISEVTSEQKEEIRRKTAGRICRVACLHGDANLNIRITMEKGKETSEVQIKDTHTNVVLVKKNGELLFQKDCKEGRKDVLSDRSWLTVAGIYEFAAEADLAPFIRLLENQIRDNEAIAREGMKNPYGASIGRAAEAVFQNRYSHGIAYASAGSDARMSGCQMSVVTNSGSGNQGITVSVPVITCAREQGSEEESLYRALLAANLIAIHIKTGIGRLSAYCGVVCAAAGAFAGIAFLEGQKVEVVERMITNHLGTIAGMVCDGAKESCASKIASALFSAMLGYEMAKENTVFRNGCGIIRDNVENTIDAVCTVGCMGMKETDQVILDLMTNP